MSDNNVTLSSQLAIEEISVNVEKAFFMFGLNYHNKNSLEATHNYGVFLSKYGKEVSNLKRPLQLAERLLNDAVAISKNFASLKELGDLYYSTKKYKKAACMYYDALSYRQDALTSLNLANCLFLSGELSQGIIILETALQNAHLSKTSWLNAYMQLTLFLALDGRFHDAQCAFRKLMESDRFMVSPDSLQLAYLCENYDYVLSNYQQVMDEWYFDPVTFQIVYQAYNYCRKQEVFSYLDEYRIRINLFFDHNPDFDISEKMNLLSIVDNGPYSPEIHYIPQFYWSAEFMESTDPATE